MKIADENEKENNLDEAIEQYKRAADLYEAERTSKKGTYYTCLIKRADLLCRLDKPNAFDEAKLVRISFNLGIRKSWHGLFIR